MKHKMVREKCTAKKAVCLILSMELLIIHKITASLLFIIYKINSFFSWNASYSSPHALYTLQTM